MKTVKRRGEGEERAAWSQDEDEDEDEESSSSRMEGRWKLKWVTATHFPMYQTQCRPFPVFSFSSYRASVWTTTFVPPQTRSVK